MSQVRKSSRANFGVNSQRPLMPGVDDEMQKKASKLLWVFYKKGDPKPFTLEYKYSRWEKEFTLPMRLAMQPKDRCNVWYDGEWIRASLCALCVKEKVSVVEKQVFETVAAADSSLTDISFAP